MIAVKTKKGEFKYKEWQWYIAWFIVWLMGVVIGALIF